MMVKESRREERSRINALKTKITQPPSCEMRKLKKRVTSGVE